MKNILALVLVISVLLLSSLQSSAQVNNKGSSVVPEPTEFFLATITSPEDDSVLAHAPLSIGLKFPQPARVVKLVIYTDQGNLVNIGFRFNPEPANEFNWPLPTLAEAKFYTVEWAALPPNNKIENGKFRFDFGAGAEPPSKAE